MINQTTVELNNIADQMERAFEGDAWHGSSISEVLSNVCSEEAAARPLPAAHTIWEIVLHMSVWQRTVRERLQGRPLLALPDEEDWPAVAEFSSAAWGDAVLELRNEYELLREEALRWKDEDLGQTTEGERFTVYQMLHGVVQHGLYHAGQIAIIKKAAAEVLA
jgi:uncharacterized damage-inducible protein DinB